VQLVDTSVWAQKQNPGVKPWFDAAMIRGEIAVCDQIALEILAGATNRKLYSGIRWIATPGSL
jgi:predicted nucleic acid-binding protein